MKKQKSLQKFIAPLIASFFIVSGCSQNQSGLDGENGSTSSTVNKGSSGTSKGTIDPNGSSSVSTSSNQGDRSNFNYLPGQGPDSAGGNTGDGDITLAGLSDPNNLLSQRVIYFDYDKSTIRPEFLILINTHAKLVAKYPHLRIRLEGHADERGSREYNVALSAARAQSVKQLMGTQGARGNQIRTIGYGEEVPIVAGQGERSWQKNRRVEIKYHN